MARWAAAPMDRRQMQMFTPTLDEMIPEDHPARLFDEILTARDWSAWESHYVLVAGQPPIHPRIVAEAILYGLSEGVRSSRQLERACKNRIDFIWLAEGRKIDHSTFCNFRTRFGRELKDLFRQIGQMAIQMGMIRLNQVALDGTRVKANSSRHGTASAKTLTGRMAELDEQIESMFAQAEEADKREDDLFGNSSPNRLPKALSTLQRRQELLRKALAAAKKKEANRKDGQVKSRPVKVPVADPDSSIQPNKEGGYAPNYTPTATTDGHKGMIVDSDVLADSDEGQVTVATVDRIEESFGEKPEQLLADSAHGSGENLAGLAERQVEGYIPLEQREDSDENPARRENLSEPVARSDWSKLPRNTRTGKLGRHAFVFDSSGDCYYCPMGQRLGFGGLKQKSRRHGKRIAYRVYRCGGCGGCPLAGKCLSGRAKFREVLRDEHEEFRELMDAMMNSPGGREVYRRRKWIAETPFGLLKSAMGLRQFLLRGLSKVKTEWLWACTAFNLSKLVREVVRLRVEFAAIPL